MPADTVESKGTEHSCTDCGAPQPPCAKCGGTSFSYEPTCDVCHKPIKRSSDSPRGWFRDAAGRILSVHTACVAAYQMKCSICGAAQDAQGDVRHDVAKHLETAAYVRTGQAP